MIERYHLRDDYSDLDVGEITLDLDQTEVSKLPPEVAAFRDVLVNSFSGMKTITLEMDGNRYTGLIVYKLESSWKPPIV